MILIPEVAADEEGVGSAVSKETIVVRSTFLAPISELISTRTKPIRHRGRFEVEHGSDEAGEWLRLMFRRASGPHVVVELMSDHVAQVYVRSARKADRGKVLFRLEEIRLPANAERIVEAAIATFQAADYSYANHDQLREYWISISCRVVAEDI
jgi:hypothetical protein